jgi:hypothetical protein
MEKSKKVLDIIPKLTTFVSKKSCNKTIKNKVNEQ